MLLKTEIEKNIGAKDIEIYKNKKSNEKIKQEFLNYLRENDEVEEIDEINITNVIDPGEAIRLINCYEELIRNQNTTWDKVGRDSKKN